MAGSSTSLTAIQAAIATKLDAIPGLKVYDSEPTQLDSLPAATIGMPILRRVPVDRAENQLGSFTWDESWPVRVYVPGDDIEYASTLVFQLVAQIVAAFDADPTIGNEPGVQDARCVNARPFEGALRSTGQPIAGYEITLDVEHFT